MKIAVEGCCHGELDKIYETIKAIERENAITVDLLLICGDFQAVRNRGDLDSMAVPNKFKLMNTFYKYYSGEKIAPVLTLFIGGNHEASNYLQELPYGGWVAPNIYYMGYAGFVNYRGVRIGGLSGIYKKQDYSRGHFERPPYNGDSVRSAYHVRNIEVFRLKQVRDPVHIFMSHDWPRGIYSYGNSERLLQQKPFFRDEVARGELGSPAAEELLHHLQPSYWFSAHLHVKFAAVVQHQNEGGSGKVTKFLALDKCLPRRQFLQVLDVAHDDQQPSELQLDAEWLCILKNTNHLLSTGPGMTYMPGPGCGGRHDFVVSAEDRASLRADFGGNLAYPKLFQRTAPAHSSSGSGSAAAAAAARPTCLINPQTDLLCKMLSITNPNAVFCGASHTSVELSDAACDEGQPLNKSVNPEEIALDDDSEGGDAGTTSGSDSDDPDTAVAGCSEQSFSSFIDSYVLPDLPGSSPLSPDSASIPGQPPADASADRPPVCATALGNTAATPGDSPASRRPLCMPPAKDPLTVTLADEASCKRNADDASLQSNAVASNSDRQTTGSLEESSGAATKDVPSSASSGTPAVKRFRGRNVALYSILHMGDQHGGDSAAAPPTS